MTHELRIVPEAEAEILAVARRYESQQPGLGAQFVAMIDLAFSQIARIPAASPLWRQGYPYRCYVVRRFPYVIFFTSSEREVEITAVAHMRRKPGYWLNRAPGSPK